MNLSRGRANKSPYPPSGRRCRVTSPRRGGASAHQLPPTDMSVPPPLQYSISITPDSSLVCSQLPRWLHWSWPVPAPRKNRFYTALHLACVTPVQHCIRLIQKCLSLSWTLLKQPPALGSHSVVKLKIMLKIGIV